MQNILPNDATEIEVKIFFAIRRILREAKEKMAHGEASYKIYFKDGGVMARKIVTEFADNK